MSSHMQEEQVEIQIQIQIQIHFREMSGTAEQEREHKCPATCRKSKYNCPINMQNMLWKAIHEDKYDR